VKHLDLSRFLQSRKLGSILWYGVTILNKKPNLPIYQVDHHTIKFHHRWVLGGQHPNRLVHNRSRRSSSHRLVGKQVGEGVGHLEQFKELGNSKNWAIQRIEQ